MNKRLEHPSYMEGLGAGIVQFGEQKSQGELIHKYKHLMADIKEGRGRLF